MFEKTSMTKIGVLSLMVCTSLATSLVTLASTALAQRTLDPTPQIKSLEAQNFQNRQHLYRLETLQRQNGANQSRGCR